MRVLKLTITYIFNVIPNGNSELLNRINSITQKNLLDTWKGQLKNPSKYILISPQDLMSSINKNKYDRLIDYLKQRYW